MDYLVLDRNYITHRVALVDRFGSLHVAVFQGGLPALGASLKGTEPALGPGVLVDVAQNVVHGVEFEAVACEQRATFDML